MLLMVSLPGLKPSDFRVSLVGDRQVYIEGTAHYRHPVPRESMALAERPYGSFQRTVNLPFPAVAQGVDVRLSHGILTVSLPIRRQPLALRWVRPEEVR
jgi:HSP20 family protein